MAKPIGDQTVMPEQVAIEDQLDKHGSFSSHMAELIRDRTILAAMWLVANEDLPMSDAKYLVSKPWKHRNEIARALAAVREEFE